MAQQPDPNAVSADRRGQDLIEEKADHDHPGQINPNHSFKNEPWDIEAKNGRLLSHSVYREEVVELWDDVLAVQLADNGQYITIQTQSLTVYPEREFAETDQKVYIDNNSGRTSAAGMKAFFQGGKFIFYSTPTERVHTIFLPEFK